MKLEDNRKYSDLYIIKRLALFAKPYWWQFLLALIMTFSLVLIDLLPAFLQGEIIGVLGNNLTNQEKLNLIFIYVGFYVGVIIVAMAINFANAMLLQRIGQKILYKIRFDVFTHIDSLSISQINAEPVGKLVTRVTSDTATLNEFFTNVLVNMIRYTLTIFAVLTMMFIISVKLTLMMLIILPILAIVTFIFKRNSRNANRLVRKNVSEVNAFLSENISGIKVTQIFNQESKKYIEFKQKNENLKKNSIKEILVFGIFQPTIYVLYVLAQIIVIYNGVYSISNGKLEIKNFVKFYGYINSVFNPIQQLAEIFNQMQRAFASTEKILSVLDTPKEVLDAEDAIEISEFKGKIEFKNVWFAYNSDNWILKDVSFIVNPKETCAFVGATGAGKTTILALIVRNYDIQKGNIYIDDIDIRKIKIESLRKHIGQMLQDVFMFSGTIKSNITLRSEEFSDEEVRNAVRYVKADQFIEKLTGAYEHEILERGSNLSAGQRQLISFARTIIHKPNIMILDEATANIDTETERLIQVSLEKMRNIGTMLIVAHRLSTIQHADKIVVLKKGEIVEIGNHQELLKKRGMYYNLYQIQYKNQE